MVSVGFARWRSRLASGGNRYDEALVAGLPAHGVALRVHDVDGPWPLPLPIQRRRLAEMLAGEEHWLIGNIVGSAVPDLLEGSVADGRRVTLLMHYFPADDPALSVDDRARLAASEADAVTAASDVVVTSEWAAREVARRYGRGDAVVAVPGMDPAPLSPGAAGTGPPGPPGLLWLGRMTATKDPLTFVEALVRLADLDWTARLVGPDALDVALTGQVRVRIREAGLDHRIVVPGEWRGDALETLWGRTDLLVHTSRSETYGMVVAEALARGIPSIVADGTGAVEAQAGIGATFPPGDVDALTESLRTWLTDPELRARWRAAAVATRPQLATWDDTVRIVASVLR